jgi:hypothetical protein
MAVGYTLLGLVALTGFLARLVAPRLFSDPDTALVEDAQQ